MPPEARSEKTEKEMTRATEGPEQRKQYTRERKENERVKARKVQAGLLVKTERTHTRYMRVCRASVRLTKKRVS